MPEEQVARMTITGWTFLIVSWTSITALVVFCLARLFKAGGHLETDETPID